MEWLNDHASLVHFVENVSGLVAGGVSEVASDLVTGEQSIGMHKGISCYLEAVYVPVEVVV